MKFCPICKRNWEDEFRVCPIDGLALQALPAETDPYLGVNIGQARVTDKIADGEMGPIYQAQDSALGTIAIQFIAADRLASPVLAEAFQDVVNQVAKVNHPNVVRVYSSAYTPDGHTAVLMEYVKGSTLTDYRQTHSPLEIQEVCRIVKGAGEGISAAHRLSIMHGSLQPSRIFISVDAKIKVAGFHRSGLRDDGSPFVLGEGLPYIAPEKAGIVNDIAVPDYRVDIYSLGAILYELFTGKPPYEAKTSAELDSAMAAGPPLPPNHFNPQVSPTLSRVTLKALSRHPADRYQSMNEFVRELDAALQPMQHQKREEPEVHGSPSPRYEDGFGKEEGWAEKRPEDEGSFFDWFKTRTGGRVRDKEEPIRADSGDSTYSRKSSLPGRGEIEERTVIAGGRKERSRPRKLLDTMSFPKYRNYQDLSSTDALPQRRLSNRAYIWMGVAAAVVLTGIFIIFWLTHGPAAGKLKVESIPTGAGVYLGEEYLGSTPLTAAEIKEGTYRLNLRLEGYEPAAADLEMTPNANIEKSFSLIPKTQLPVQTESTQPAPPPPPPPQNPTENAKAEPYAGMVSRAIAARNFFPPAQGNAWDILQTWKRQASANMAEWEPLKQSFCKELEMSGGEKLDQKDFQSVRILLDQVMNRVSDPACAGKLQARFESSISQSVAELRGSLNAAMNRQSYVTPEYDNALKYVRLILHIEPQDPEAKTLRGDIYTRSLEQAHAKSEARQHQDALEIYMQLKSNYPDAPGGLDAINKNIERETRKLQLLNAMKTPFAVQVKHGHSFFKVMNRECTGFLRVSGFSVEYQSNGSHSFKVTYDNLKSIAYSKGKITIESNTIENGKIELDQADKNPSPSLEDVYKKIEEYRKLYSEYMHL
jgi:serine/threonine protein kinase